MNNPATIAQVFDLSIERQLSMPLLLLRLQCPFHCPRKPSALLALLLTLFCTAIGSQAHAATAGVAEPPDNVNTVDGSTTATAYHLATLGNLVWLHDQAAAGFTLRRYYRMTQDIDASDTANWNDPGTTINRLEGFAPIGDSVHPFGGVLDGDGHKITGLTIHRPTTDYIALFAYVSAGNPDYGARRGYARFSNLQLKDCSIVGTKTVAGLVGFIEYGAIRNCIASGTVTGTGMVGLIAANMRGTPTTYCSASGSVTGGDYVGILLGYCLAAGGYSDVRNCVATGTATGNLSVGGLVGYGYMVSDSQANATVLAAGNAGGLAGSASASNCTAVGNVSSTNTTGKVGGLLGSGTALNSYATGDVNAPYGNDVGGLIGASSNAQYCYALGPVVGSNNVGGLVGSSTGPVLFSSSSGAVHGLDMVGGLVGYVAGGSEVKLSYATGAVFARYHAGGLVGVADSSSRIIYCQAANRLTVVPEQTDLEICAGGLVGRNGGRIQDSYASADCMVKLDPAATYPNGVYLASLAGLQTGLYAQVISSYACGPVAIISTANGQPLHPASAKVGGLNGFINDDTVVLDSFWDIQTTGQPTSAGDLGLGLTTLQMRDIATKTNWDFASVWGLQGGYPYLRGLPTRTITYRAAAGGTLGLDPAAGATTFPVLINPGARLMPVFAAGTPGFPFIRWSDGLTTNPRTDAGLLADTTLTAFFGTSTAACHWPAYE